MKLNVTKQRGLWWTISALAVVASIIAMAISWTNPQIQAPLRPSLDFIGGTRLQLSLDCKIAGNCDQPIDIVAVREVVDSQGLPGSSIQIASDKNDKDKKTSLSIRTKNLDVEQRTQLESALSEKIGVFDINSRQIDTVGPVIGRELFTKGMLALAVSFVGIAVYLSFRFQLDYAILAIIALFHDVFITVGVFAVLGLVFGIEVDSLFIVALLTIIGFSVNDTVVIYDRIRETIAQNPELSINEIVDAAVNQTLGRSINTTLTALLPLTAIFLFGGETLKYFALALIVGFLLGAYSSIFIASTLLAWWRNRQVKSTLT
jgi:preprotein translocase subunit SecF